LPIAVIKELERLFAKFLWRNKMHAWSWETLCKLKIDGGVGIRIISDLCIAA